MVKLRKFKIKNTYLTQRGYALLKDENKECTDYLRELLTVTPKVNPSGMGGGGGAGDESRAFPIYRENSQKLYIPRALGFEMFGPPRRNTLHTGLDCPRLIFNGSLRKEQDAPVNAFLEAANDPLRRGGIISLVCASGKTVIALYIATVLKKKMLVLCHKEFLMNQWKERISQFIPTARVGVIKAKRIDTDDCDIVIASIQSVSMKEYDPAIFQEYGFSVCDECFPYTQKIMTEDGPMDIGLLYNKWEAKEAIPRVLSFNEQSRQTEYKTVTYAWRKENPELLKISFSKSNIKCTRNHKILTLDGYIEAHKLKVGDLMQCNYTNSLNESMVAKSLNPDQYQIMLGSFLGDGYIHTLPSKRYRIKIIHCEKQYEYCKWKAGMLNIDKIIKINSNGYSSKIAYSFNSKLFDLPDHKYFPKTKNTCPQWILDELDYKGIAIWWMDDGSLSKKGYSGTISTCSFDEDTHIRMVKRLKDLNIDCYYKNDGKGYLSLFFNKKEICKLLNYIMPYLHDNLKYKFINEDIKTAFQEYYYGDLSTNYNCVLNINSKLYLIGSIFTVKNTIYKYQYCKKCKTNKFQIFKNICRCNHSKTIKDWDIPDIEQKSYKWNDDIQEIGTVKISKIETVKTNDYSYCNRVYDIEVEDNHNFICSSIGGIGPIVHNCHHLSAEVFSRALPKITTQVMLGLSATLNRKDGLRKVFEWYLGKPVFETTARLDSQMIINVVRVPAGGECICCENYGKELLMWNGKRNVAAMINSIAECTIRNKLLLDTLEDTLAADPERKVLILSDRRGHLKYLECEIGRRKLGTVGYYVGGMKEDALKKSESMDIILGTYSMASEGMDIPCLNTLVLASPISSIEQSIGRVQRQKPTERKYIPLVIDLCDNYSLFCNQARKRIDFYKKNGYTISGAGAGAAGDGDGEDGDESAATGTAAASGAAKFAFIESDDEE